MYENWCSYCGGKKLCDEDCKVCFDKSFASYEGKTKSGVLKVDCWSEDNEKKPREVFKSDNNKYKFKCPDCPHSFYLTLNNLTCSDSWCPYCINKKLCNDEDCKFCFDKSFASYEGKTPSGISKVSCWSKKNKKKPREVVKGSGKNYKFDCLECNKEFSANPNHITNKNNWCPNCKNKTEKKLLDWLESSFSNMTIMKEIKFSWCGRRRFDFYIKELNLIIELDGRQHFEIVKLWKSSVEDNRNTDIEKMYLANKNGITVIRLLQKDVYNDKNDWESKLRKHIKKYNKPKNIYISNNYEYISHKYGMVLKQMKETTKI